MSQPPYGPPGPPQWQPKRYNSPPQTPPPMPMPAPLHGPGAPMYPQPPMRHGKTVAKQRMGGSTHTIHLVLTIFTCGAWAPIWFIVWLITRRKTVTRY